jgi:hypothetical protein
MHRPCAGPRGAQAALQARGVSGLPARARAAAAQTAPKVVRHQPRQRRGVIDDVCVPDLGRGARGRRRGVGGGGGRPATIGARGGLPPKPTARGTRGARSARGGQVVDSPPQSCRRT